MLGYLFGPVPSRRLGISLGGDLVPPGTCCLYSIYGECGKTDEPTIEVKRHIDGRSTDFYRSDTESAIFQPTPVGSDR